jgi:hypothetical protein
VSAKRPEDLFDRSVFCLVGLVVSLKLNRLFNENWNSPPAASIWLRTEILKVYRLVG